MRFIGAGIRGSCPLDTLRAVSGVRPLAVRDGHLLAAKEAAGGDVFTTRDYPEVLARRDIDAGAAHLANIPHRRGRRMGLDLKTNRVFEA